MLGREVRGRGRRRFPERAPPELAPVPADRGPNASTLFALHDELRAVRMRNAELEAALRACRGGSRVSSDEIDDLDDLDDGWPMTKDAA